MRHPRTSPPIHGTGWLRGCLARFCSRIYGRIDNDTPSLAAITEVAPGVLFSDLDILVTPTLAFAIVLNCFTSALVHSRRTIFLALAIFAPVL